MVTILIPCYNCEKYIRKCLDSCINQTYKNIKILVVDDGSTDNSKKIVEEYVKKHKNIRLIVQDNKGIAGTRNVLLNNLKTTYGYFVDSDDWIEADAIEKMINVIGNNDLVINSCYIDKGKNKYKPFYITNKINVNTSNESYLINNTPFVWGILFRTSYLKKNNFWFYDKYQFFEDAGVISYWIYKTSKISFLNSPSYHYYVNKKSLSRSKNMSFNKILSAIEQLNHFYRLLRNEKFNSLPNSINDQLAFYHSILFTYIEFMSNINKKEKKILKNKLRTLERDNFKLRTPKCYWKKWYFILYRMFLY